MPKNIFKILKEIEKESKLDFFLFASFFLYPKETLTTKENQYFILNDNFLKFLVKCLENKDFLNKLDAKLITNLLGLLRDWKDYIEYYQEILRNPDFQNFCENKSWRNNYQNMFSPIELLSIISNYENVGWIYRLNKDYDVENANLNLIKDLINKIITVKNEKRIDFYSKEIIIQKIINDDYNDKYSCYLNKYKVEELIHTIMCDNDFLDICSILLTKKLDDEIIINIIKILKASIGLKTLDYKIDFNFAYYYQLIDKNKLKQFDYQRAKRLMNLFLIKQNKQKKSKINLVKK